MIAIAKELTENELAFALEIILRSNSAAIPIMRSRGSTKDISIGTLRSALDHSAHVGLRQVLS